jgi:hypothetical protein
LQYADLVMGGELDYRAAVHHCHYDGVVALAMVRNAGLTADTLADFDGMLDGFGERVAAMMERDAATPGARL